MVNDRQQILNLITSNKQAFSKFGASKIGLFGSFVRGEQTAESDVDLLVEFKPGLKNYRNLLGTAELAEGLVGRKVEIVTTESISPFIAPYIEKEVEYVQIA
ncbi:MAG: polymerase beta domain protein region protein [Candidatus Nomurabacteria bacterium GW2011_GWA1_46_11]|uniref:Polymerase beta domain protein region protein n=1 Tax=Candidatus Nomurabacteria bacterium GW2011_GWA1_46_11 TaxID=1618732 RepID=A0A0G1RN47_9BACT|nr:MAG: polymerase beta domain protein region protein [Microgenomates group bacterium GW2011_GWA2_44_7]KKT78292.1 MAG: polymerase beta domain protein region protein [Microgenomates group bacterium GW2011_GWB1_44_8]KKU22350.1 MAG: polymerase beta domain protein region protein [Candidatus Nomurabacteria bacterium GW2011_GWA1_46_11]